MISYLDTSAAMKLLLEEAESAALVEELSSAVRRDLVASWLLHTELHCAASRHPDDINADDVTVVLDSASLVDLTRGDLLTAASLPGGLRSHDALHLAVALRVGADELVTYDDELSEAARSAGLRVLRPA